MKIKKFVPVEFAANNWLLFDEKNQNALLFDCAGNFSAIANFLEKNNLNLEKIIITHAHFDHIGDCAEYKKHFPKVKIFLPKNDIMLYQNLTMQCDLFGVRRVDNFEVDEFIDEKTEIFFNDKKIEVIETPGHSKGSTCYLIKDLPHDVYENTKDEGKKDVLIAGDTVFYEEIGRCDLPTGSFADITNSFKKLFKLPEKTILLTGHGEDSSIKHEKVYNTYFGSAKQ